MWLGSDLIGVVLPSETPSVKPNTPNTDPDKKFKHIETGYITDGIISGEKGRKLESDTSTMYLFH